jgi:pseudaminic acid biosynthesis-associated methylase
MADPDASRAAMRLRPARSGDCHRVWQLNNEAGARAASRSSAPIPLDEHRRWFGARLADPDTALDMIESGPGPAAGVVRVERQGDSAELSLAIDPDARGRGLGRAAVRAAAVAALARWPDIAIDAWVEDDNRPSIRCFEAAGFVLLRSDPISARRFHLYRLRRGETMSGAASGPDTEQLALWRSDFGRTYTDRNDRELPGRVAAWREMMAGLPIASVLEVGCNLGWNLTYLSRIGTYRLVGVEPQADVVRRARRRSDGFAVLEGSAFDLPFKDASFDLVFTSGVLIHVHPRDLPAALSEIERVSRKFLLYVEYDHPSEVEMPYRGKQGALWKRDHHAAWMAAAPGLRSLRRGLWGREHDYDDCGWCLFEKP